MSKNKISIEVHSTGDLLSECTRVYLHSGNPSAMLSRIIKGIQAFESECAVKDDRELANVLVSVLERLRNETSASEHELYAPDLSAASDMPFVRTYTPSDYDPLGEDESEKTIIMVEESELIDTQARKNDSITPSAIDAVRVSCYDR